MPEQNTEAEWADRFDQDVQTLLHSAGLTGQTDLPQDYLKALAVAQTLRSTEVTHLSRVRYSLRQRLIRSGEQPGVWSNKAYQGVHTMKTGLSKLTPARQALIVLTLLVLILSLSLTIQPVRALAGQILGQVGFFNFTNETAVPEEWIGQENFNSAAQSTSLPEEDLRGISESEAEQQVGFVLYTPAYFPECFTLNSRNILAGQDTPMVLTAYHCPGQVSGYDAVFLNLYQARLQGEPATEFPIGDAQPVEITVRGQKGLWIDQAPIGVQSSREGKTELMPVNMLVWEESGFLFQLHSNKLSQEEMLRVAESLE